MKTWLFIDANYICHRAFHTTGDLSHEGVRTGVVFGFLREVVDLLDQHATSRVAFCFDSKTSLRRVSYPSYKANRQERTKEEERARKELHKQIRKLRRDYLPSIGFQNIFQQSGYEADDIIASLCQSLPKRTEAIVVSADHDLYQLLSKRVLIWNPHKKAAITQESFTKEWGVSPSQWVDVKAIAGCSTDNVEGVRGIGEKTAVKFLAGDLKTSSKSHAKIVEGNHIWRRNIPLVKLPLVGVKTFTLARDEVTEQSWRRLIRQLGMESLWNRRPQ